jgi:hypothetical protein
LRIRDFFIAKRTNAIASFIPSVRKSVERRNRIATSASQIAINATAVGWKFVKCSFVNQIARLESPRIGGVACAA